MKIEDCLYAVRSSQRLWRGEPFPIYQKVKGVSELDPCADSTVKKTAEWAPVLTGL